MKLASSTRLKRSKQRYTKERQSRKLIKEKSDSRSSSLHSLVQTTTFWNNQFKSAIMLATATNSPNQFGKQFNPKNNNNNNYNNNARREFSKSKMIPIKNTHRQVIPQHYKNSNPIQIRTNGYQTNTSFQNSELTVNLTNNEPRLVIFNNNNISNQMNYNLPNNNNYRETKFFTSHFNNNNNNNSVTNKLFHHSKQRQQTQQSDLLGVSNSLPPSQSTNFKRFNPRFKYVNKSACSKNSAPYNTTQYIMFDYSRRRKDQECTNEQQSFTDEWNMALAASQAEDQKTSFNNTSIINDNLNEFSLDEDTSQKQLSLSEHNLNLIEQDEPMCGEEEDESERMQQLSSSL